MIFKTKNKQKILGKSEVNRSTINNKPKRSGTNRYCSIVGCPSVVGELCQFQDFSVFQVPPKNGPLFHFMFIFTSFPKRVIPPFHANKGHIFSKNSFKKNMKKTF